MTDVINENEKLKKMLNLFMAQSYAYKDLDFEDLTIKELKAVFDTNKQLVR